MNSPQTNSSQTNKAFEHRQSAHCETGVISNLLRHHGLDVSEPMVFGLASGVSYAYLPVIKINGLPLLSYRMPPRMIIRLLCRRIKGLNISFNKFKDSGEGMRALDRKLSAGEIVGLQTSVFFLPYFPKDMRFHFNAHNLIVFSKEGDTYKISDPVFSHLVEADSRSLQKARFARGALAPKGMAYYPVSVPKEIDFSVLIPKSIRLTGKLLGRWNPVPFSGVNGMRMVAKKIRNLDKADQNFARLFLGQIVRMQEEIGTGGAGFRFMYAAFLQESGEKLNNNQLSEAAIEMTRIGDEWREFALLAAKTSKQRAEHDYNDIASQLTKVANAELALFNQLSGFKL